MAPRLIGLLFDLFEEGGFFFFCFFYSPAFINSALKERKRPGYDETQEYRVDQSASADSGGVSAVER